VCIAGPGDYPSTLAKSSNAFNRFCGNAAIIFDCKINRLRTTSVWWKAATHLDVIPLLQRVSVLPTCIARTYGVFVKMPLIHKKKAPIVQMLPSSSAAK
jgi:hypothetical protein